MTHEKMYLSIINNLRDGVYFVDPDRRITFWNRASEEISGYTAGEIVGRKCDDNLLSHIDGDGRPLCITGCPLFATMIDNKHRREHVFLRHKDGHRISTMINVFPMIDEDGQTIGAIEIYTSGAPMAADDDLIGQLSDMAMNDELTGLPNRSYLESFLEFKLKAFYRFNQLFAVMMLDIDELIAFNEDHGHDNGDVVLKGFSASIRESVGKHDLFGRWGGDKFLGIFSLNQPDDAAIIGEKLRMLVDTTQVPCEGERLSVTASIGMAIVGEADTVESLVERAGKLMYNSKISGKNRVSVDGAIGADINPPAARDVCPE